MKPAHEPLLFLFQKNPCCIFSNNPTFEVVDSDDTLLVGRFDLLKSFNWFLSVRRQVRTWTAENDPVRNMQEECCVVSDETGHEKQLKQGSPAMIFFSSSFVFLMFHLLESIQHMKGMLSHVGNVLQSMRPVEPWTPLIVRLLFEELACLVPNKNHSSQGVLALNG